MMVESAAPHKKDNGCRVALGFIYSFGTRTERTNTKNTTARANLVLFWKTSSYLRCGFAGSRFMNDVNDINGVKD